MTTAIPTRLLGKTGLQLPILSFGASSLGGEFRQVKLDDALASVREAMRRTGAMIAVIQDLQGPKIRIGGFGTPWVDLRAGALRMTIRSCARDCRCAWPSRSG